MSIFKSYKSALDNKQNEEGEKIATTGRKVYINSNMIRNFYNIRSVKEDILCKNPYYKEHSCVAAVCEN